MSIPQSMRLRILEESDFQCAYCGHRDGLNLTAHHIVHEAERGPTEDDNLIALCQNCHNRHHDTATDEIPTKDLRRLKRHLVQRWLTQPGVNALRLAYQKSFGVVSFPFAVQHLVDARLLVYVKQQMSYGGVEVTALYQITDKGKALAERWLGEGKDGEQK